MPKRRIKRDLTYNGVTYKSGFEKAIAQGLTENDIRFEYEKQAWRYPYSIKAASCSECGSKHVVKIRKYTPDFFMWSEDWSKGIVLETKGRLMTNDRTIITHAAAYAVEHGIDYRLLFQRDAKLPLKKTPTYLAWAESIGVKAYAGPAFPSDILQDLDYE